MTIRQRIKQNINLPVVISDHADWKELIQTIREVSPRKCFCYHGREEALLSFEEERLQL